MARSPLEYASEIIGRILGSRGRLRSASPAHEETNATAAAGRLVRLDYPYSTESRWGHGRPSNETLRAKIASRRESYARLLARFAELRADLCRIAVDRDGLRDDEPSWVNGWLPGLDGLAIYGLLALGNPRVYLEVGSGNSTRFARRAIRDHGLRTQVVSIDPEPRAKVDHLCDRVYRTGLESVDLAIFEDLHADDVVFVDNSHRSFSSSDVTVFFLDVIPRLPAGVIYGLHDIFLPDDYPPSWADFFYNEQFLLAAYLLGGGDGDEIVLPGAFVSTDPELRSIYAGVWEGLPAVERHGVGFWLRRSDRSLARVASREL